METVSSKQVKHLIKATFPNYRKRTVFIKQAEKTTIHDVNWSGGTKSEYRACSIDGRPLETTVNMGVPAPWDNPYEGLEINIPQGMVVVQGGYFCGKAATLFITINPLDIPLLNT